MEARLERRKNDGRLSSGVRQSPANRLVFLVMGVIAISAAASALFGDGYGTQTPHGKVLGTLQRVAGAEEEYRGRTGHFAGRLEELGAVVAESVAVVLRGSHDGAGWEAVVRHPVGLTCVQSGRVERGRAIRDPPSCFTEAPQ